MESSQGRLKVSTFISVRGHDSWTKLWSFLFSNFCAEGCLQDRHWAPDRFQLSVIPTTAGCWTASNVPRDGCYYLCEVLHHHSRTFSSLVRLWHSSTSRIFLLHSWGFWSFHWFLHRLAIIRHNNPLLDYHHDIFWHFTFVVGLWWMQKNEEVYWPNIYLCGQIFILHMCAIIIGNQVDEAFLYMTPNMLGCYLLN